MPSSYEIGADDFGDDYGDETGDETGMAEMFGDDCGDETGMAEMFGDDYGAAAPRRASPGKQLALLRRQLAKQAKVLRRVQAGGERARLPTGLRITESPPTRDRETVLGFSLSVAASGTADVIIAPQRKLFRGERLVFDTAAAANFLILDIVVGNNSQKASSGAIPASVYAVNAIGVRMAFDPCELGKQITLTVQNTDAGAAHTALGAIIGRAVDLAGNR